MQRLVGQGRLSSHITIAALNGVSEANLGEADLVAAVLALMPEHFYKSMEAEKSPGHWQDVYHLPYQGVVLYIKLQIRSDGRAVVVQCKPR
jgi:hypothetical protein